jgi:hypothetical protein
MTARLLIVLALTHLLAACGACDGHFTNSGTSSARCSVFSMPW